ncbi:Protein CAP22 [Fusarium oxysporum f. sp. albedinis]|nr:Protein CAP22 [Fusarium oxysporum f. sp. albedinis]
MRNNTGSYRIPVAVQFAWSLVLCFAREGCLLSRRTRRLPSDHPALKAELAEIQASYNYEKSLGEAFWLDCFRPPLLKRQCTGMAIQALHGFVISMITSAIYVTSTIPGMYAIDRWGHRPLLLLNARLLFYLIYILSFIIADLF